MSKKKHQQSNDRVRMNDAIRARELRVIDDEKGNLGVISRDEALRIAQESGLDLIEISPDAQPPVAKIMDYGKFQYENKKKQREIRAKAKAAMVEVKEVQIKPGTGENDALLKAKRGSEWLEQGHRLKVEIFLRGREKYMDKSLHEAHINKFLTFLTVPFEIVDQFKKVPKGYALIVAKDKKAKKNSETEQES